MHGLRCSPEIAGFTRLLDEWVVGLTRYTHEAAGVFVDPALFARSFTEAATRVRAFAWGAGEVKPTQLEGDVTTFELQGYDYSVAVKRLTVSSPEQLAAEAETAMLGAAEAAPDVAEHLRVGVVLVSVTAPAGASDAELLALAHGFRDVTRGLSSTGAAWSFPSADEGPAYAYCGPGFLGGILLVRRVLPE